MSHRYRNHGFTMVEILSVLAILAVIAAFIVPNMNPLVESLQLRSAASGIRHKLLLAKTRALGDSRIHCGVFFDTGSTPQSVYAFFDDADAGNKGYYDPGIDQRYMEPFELSPTIKLKITGAGTNRSIIFRGDGSSTVHGMQLSVETKSNCKKIISVLPSTGRIAVTTP